MYRPNGPNQHQTIDVHKTFLKRNSCTDQTDQTNTKQLTYSKRVKYVFSDEDETDQSNTKPKRFLDVLC